MALIKCPECGTSVSDKATACPKCGYPIKPQPDIDRLVRSMRWGYEWKTKAKILGWPLIHIAIGRNKDTGKLMGAKGIIAIGQFGIGIITIAQFGIGLLFGLGQFVGGLFAIGQFGAGVLFCLGQFAIGLTAIGQMAFGDYVRASVGYGNHVWSGKIKDPQAIGYFTNLLYSLKSLNLWYFLKGLIYR